jgi:hypothetical protein
MKRRGASDLRRRPSVREPKRRFTIFSEGRNTEPTYFRALAEACIKALIEVIVVPSVGVPYTIAEQASKRARELGVSPSVRRRRDSYEEGDEVWAVFDRDTHPRIKDAVELCKKNRVGIADSNSCFELWLILHEADYDKPDASRAAQNYLRKLRPEYDPTSRKLTNCSELIARIEEAEKRAEAQLERRESEGVPNGVPSTTVFRLTRSIRNAAKLFS